MTLRDETGQIEDRWTRIEPGAPITGPAILTLEDALARDAELAGIEPTRLGLHIRNDVEGRDVAAWLHRVSLISVDFPSFADGRGFSIGRVLRRLGFEGRLRAHGPVITDQFAYLLACGFDEVQSPEALSNRQPDAQWSAAKDAMTLGYQRSYTGPANILEARRSARRA